MFKIIFTNAAKKDLKLIAKSPFKNSARVLLEQLEKDPFCQPYEPLIGKLKGAYSRRINIQHRLVYKVDIEQNLVTVISMWGHYKDN